MAEPVDCSGFCRLCLVKEQVNIPIFEELGDLQQIYLKITACLPIKVSIEDPLPKRICDECSYKLDQQYQFWNTSLNSEKQLRQWLGLPEELPPSKSETSSKIKREKDHYESTTKRPRRNARRKAAQNVRQAAAAAIAAASDSGPGEDMDMDTFGAKEEHDTDNDLNDNTEPLTESTYMNVGIDSEEGTEAGPSGLQKNSDGAANPNQDSSGTGEHSTSLNTEIKTECIRTETKIEDSNCNGDTRVKTDIESNEDNCVKTDVKLKKRNDAKSRTRSFKLKSKWFEYAQHLVFVNNHWRFKCNVCEKLFDNKRSWYRHSLRHRLDKRYICEVCNKSFATSTERRKHKEQHDLSRPRYNCDVCNDSFTNKVGHYLHVKRVHLKNFKHQCNHCNQLFFSPSDLRTHISRVHENITYECDICNKSYTSSYYLKQHKLLHDPTSRKFVCQICGACYTGQRNLNSHTRQKHGQKKSYICETCGRNFTNIGSLNLHRTVHMNIRNFPCNTCEKKFRTRQLLKTHMVSHTGEKPFHCDRCNKSFTQRCSLTIHLRYHSGERPYPCDLCDKRFITKTILNMHKKNHHLIKVE